MLACPDVGDFLLFRIWKPANRCEYLGTEECGGNRIRKMILSGKYPKKLSESFSLGGEFRGFRLVEATTEQQINLMVNAAPEMLVSFEPIIEFPQVVEAHVKAKSS